MNKKKIRNYQIFSVIFTFILGGLLHFTYKWSGGNGFVAIFSSVNESMWEHLKLLFFPMLIITIIGYYYIGKNIPNFLCSKTIGIITAMIFMITFFYTYSGIIGKNIPVIDITTFFISTVLGELIAYLLIINNFKCDKNISIIILLIIFCSFVLFTFDTPKLGIFKDPVTEQYGIIKKSEN